MFKLQVPAAIQEKQEQKVLLFTEKEILYA